MRSRPDVYMLVLALCALTLWTTRPAGAGVELRNKLLYVNDSPFFPVGVWSSTREGRGFSGKPVEFHKQLGMNTVFVGLSKDAQGAEQFAALLQEAEQAGVMVIGYFHYGGGKVGVPWTEEQLMPYLGLKDSPALLAWCLGDDLAPQRHLSGIVGVAEFVRRHDSVHPLVGDCDGLPPEGRVPFRPYLDIMMPYQYPCTSRALDDYARYLSRMRQELRDPLWTWMQTHITDNERRKHGRWGVARWMPSIEPEQMRLLFYEAIRQNIRGVLFFGEHTLSRAPDVRAEAGILAQEMRLLGEIIAGGAFTHDARAGYTYRAPGGCACFDYKGEKLIVLTRLDRAWFTRAPHNRFVRPHDMKDFFIRVRFHGIDLSLPDKKQLDVYTVSFPAMRELRYTVLNRAEIQIRIPSIELIELIWIVPTENEQRVRDMRNRMDALLPNVARLAVEQASAHHTKVTGTQAKLKESGVTLESAEALLQEASKLTEQAQTELGAGNHAEAYTAGRTSQHKRHKAMAAYMDFADRVGRYSQLYYHLPKFFEFVDPAKMPEE